MESRFDQAVAHALLCLGQGDIVLKKEQWEAIKVVYDGCDAFVWLPTGYGKLICYQCLPFLFDYKFGKVDLPPLNQSVVIVISPLVSLMMDQVAKLRERGVKAATLGGNSAAAGMDIKLLACEKDINNGAYKLLFSAPEAVVVSERWRQLLLSSPLNNQIVALVVDECHCVYKW